MITVLESICYHLVQEIRVSKNYSILSSKINVNIVTIVSDPVPKFYATSCKQLIVICSK